MLVNGEDVTECPHCGTPLDGNARHTKGPPFLIHEPKVCRDVLEAEMRRLRLWLMRIADPTFINGRSSVECARAALLGDENL